MAFNDSWPAAVRVTRKLHVAVMAACMAFVCGCSDSQYDLVPVTGRVTLDGQPFIWGSVMFAPTSRSRDNAKAGKPAFGMLDAEGRFQLTTYNDADGAVVGEHHVTVFCVDDGPHGAPPASIPAFNRLALRGEAKTVSQGSHNEFEIALTSDQVRQYGSNR